MRLKLKKWTAEELAARRKRFAIQSLAAAVVAALLLSASFAPKLIFSIQDSRLFSTPKGITASSGSMDPKASEIYLVKAIHHLYEQGYKDHFSFLFNTEEYYDRLRQSLRDELRELGDADIINKQLLAGAVKTMENVTPMLSTYRLTTTDSVYVEREMLTVAYDGGTMWAQMEPITGKLISFTLGSAELIVPDEELTQQVMEAYVKYLGLAVLDDWTYLKPYYVSQKAQLQISAYNDTSFEIMPLNSLKA